MKIILISIKNSIKEYKGVYVLLMVSQLLAVIMLFMIYGIFCSYSAARQEFDETCYEFNAFFTEGVRKSEFSECYTEILQKTEHKLDYFYIYAISDEYEIVTYNEYYKGIFNNAKKIYKYMRLDCGRLVTEEEINKGEKVVHGVNLGRLNDLIEINEEMYRVVGVQDNEEFGSMVHMAFSCYQDDILIKNTILKFEKLPTVQEYKFFKDTLERCFGERVIVQEYKVRNEERLIAINSIIVISVVVGVIAAMDTALLYGYIMKKRKKQMAIYGICGADRFHRIIINEMEIFIVTLIMSTIGLVLFRSCVERVMNYVYENTVAIYNMEAYLLMLVTYILSIVSITTFVTIFLNRKNILDIRRECGV